jgi:chorismate mutase
MSDNTDIVQRLRGQSVGDYSVLLWEAADEIERLRANLPQLWRTKTTNAKLRADLAQRTAERDALAAEVAALKPQSNANNSAPIPLKEWVIEVFQHLCHSPHTPDEWKRDLDKKTNALLNAIEQEKEGR